MTRTAIICVTPTDPVSQYRSKLAAMAAKIRRAMTRTALALLYPVFFALVLSLGFWLRFDAPIWSSF